MKYADYKKQERGQNVLIYGAPKTGKTAMVAELANKGYTIHNLDLERGAGIFELVVEEANLNNVNIYTVEDTPSKPNAIKTVSKVFDAVGPISFCQAHGVVACPDCKRTYGDAVPKETIDTSTFGPKDVLLIDSLTQLSNSAIVHSKGNSVVLSTKKAEWDDYSAQGQLLDFVLAKAQAAPYHTIFISHEATIEQEDKSEKIMPIGGTRNYSKNLGRFFDHVVYCQIKNLRHQQISGTTENAKIIAGSRTNVSLSDGATLADLLNPSEELRKAAKEAYRNKGAKPRK